MDDHDWFQVLQPWAYKWQAINWLNRCLDTVEDGFRLDPDDATRIGEAKKPGPENEPTNMQTAGVQTSGAPETVKQDINRRPPLKSLLAYIVNNEWTVKCGNYSC